jgi:hypothetical protein
MPLIPLSEIASTQRPDQQLEAKVSAPSVVRMVPVHHYDSAHVWVWMVVIEKGYVHGPVKITHAEVKKYKKKLAVPDGSFKMAGKIDPYAYVKGKIYNLDWVPGGEEKPDTKKRFVSFDSSTGLPKEPEHEKADSIIPGWEPDDDEPEPDEYGWIDGTYAGEDALLSPAGNHIVSLDTGKVLWPDQLIPKNPYNPFGKDPIGKLDPNGLVMYAASDLEGLELSLLPTGDFAVLRKGKYVIYKRDSDGEMVPTKQAVSASDIKAAINPHAIAPPAPKIPEKKKVPTNKTPEANLKTPAADPIEPKSVPTPNDLTWYPGYKDENGADTGLLYTPNFPDLKKTDSGKYWLRDPHTDKYSLSIWIKGKDASKHSGWKSAKTAKYSLSDLTSIYGPKPPVPQEPVADDPADKVHGWENLNKDDQWGFPVYLAPNGMEYSKLPGGWALYLGGTGKYHFYKPTSKKGMLLDKSVDPVTPEQAGSSKAAAIKNRVHKTMYGVLKNGFFATEVTAKEPNDHGSIRVFHVDTDTNQWDWYQLPNGAIAQYNHQLGKYFVAKGKGDHWVPDLGSTIEPDDVLKMKYKGDAVLPGGEKVLKSKDLHGFETVSALDVANVPVIVSKLPRGVFGMHRKSQDRYEIVGFDEEGKVVYASPEGDVLPLVGWPAIRTLKRKGPLVGNWFAAGIDSAGALILARGKSKPGVVRLLPHGLLAKFSAGKYKQAKFDVDSGKISILKSAMVFSDGQVRLRALKDDYLYTGPGAVEEPVEKTSGTGPKDNSVHAEPANANIPGSAPKAPKGFAFISKEAFLAKSGPYEVIAEPYQDKVHYLDWVGSPELSAKANAENSFSVQYDPVYMPKGGSALFVVSEPGSFQTVHYDENGVLTDGAAVTAEDLGLEDEVPSSSSAQSFEVPEGWQIHDKWDRVNSHSLTPGGYNVKPIEYTGEKVPALKVISSTFNTYLSPAGVPFFVSSVEGGPTKFHADINNAAEFEQVSPEKLGILWPGDEDAPSPVGLPGSVWNPPPGFEVHSDWGDNPKSKLVKAHDYNIVPIKYTLGHHPVFSGPSNSKTLFLTPSGEIILPKHFSNGEMFFPFSPTKDGWGDPVSARSLGIVKDPVDGQSDAPSVPEYAPVDVDIPTKAEAPDTVKSVLDTKLPDASELEFDSSGAGMKGAGKKDIYKDKDGKRYLFKPALPKSGSTSEPFRAYSQEVSSVIALGVREDHIPIKAITLDGKLGTIQPMLELGDPSDLSNYPPTKLTDVEKLDVAHEHLIDWLGSQHDSHKANLVRAADGRILSIDKEQGFKYWGNDRLSTDYHPNKAYGEDEPYYNKFWKAFADGSMDFDPKNLGATFDFMYEQDSKDLGSLEISLRKYAKERYPNDSYKQSAFVASVVSRRNTAKRDFEVFITEQYAKRTGKKGRFTFKTGWIEEGKKVFTTTKTDVSKWASLPHKTAVSLPVGEDVIAFKVYEHDTDSDLVTLKISNTHESAMGSLDKAVKALGIESRGSVQGSAYSMVFVSKADLVKAGTHENTVEHVEGDDGKIEAHSGEPEYLPRVDLLVAAESNFKKVDTLAESKSLGLTGNRVFLDSDVVEGQTATVRRVIRDDVSYTVMNLKIRDAFLDAIKGTSGKYRPSQGGYVKNKDAIDQTGGSDLLAPQTFLSSRVFENAHGAIYGFPRSQRGFAMNGTLVIEVKGSSGFTEKARSLVKGLLPSIDPDRILREVTAEDRKALKLWRLLNAVDPQKHDSLLKKDKTSATAAARALEGLGMLSDVNEIQEVDVGRGYMGHVLPGRWKRAKTGNGENLLLFLSHATKKPSVVPSVLEHGLMGHIGRVLQGSPVKGAVENEDFETGGADTTQCRVCTRKTMHVPLRHGSVSGDVQFIISPDVVDRLDIVFYRGDTYGCMSPGATFRECGSKYRSRRPIDEELQGLQSNISEEMVFPRGIHPSKILRVTCSGKDDREQVILACKNAGVLEHNGVPIEDFVVVETNQGSAYNKYVKPAGF